MNYLIRHDKMAIVAADEDADKLFNYGKRKLQCDFKIMGDKAGDWIQTSAYSLDELKKLCENLTGETCNRISTTEEGAYRVLSLAASTQFKPLKEENVMAKKITKKVSKKKVSKKVSKKAPATKKAADQKNGITKPSTGSKTGQVWDICDKMKKDSRADVLAACAKKGINKSTAATQYQRWRVYNDIA